MGIVNARDLVDSPLKGNLWEILVYTEMSHWLQLGSPWQLSFWRDRSTEVDLVLHRAGRFKWASSPSNLGRLP